MRCEPFLGRSPGRCLADSAWCVFTSELSSLSEEVATLGYAAGRPSDYSPPPPPTQPRAPACACLRTRREPLAPPNAQPPQLLLATHS